MKTIKCWTILLIFLILNSFLFAQFRWETVDETIRLYPTSYVGKGTLGIYLGKSDKLYKSISGEITIDLVEKFVYINDGNNIFQFKNNLIESLVLEGIKYFNNEELNRKDFSDSLLLFYRKNLYSSLNLNQIEFSSSKKVVYDFGESGLFLKNQKIYTGKICYVSPSSIIILYENGELDEFRDGDFNFLQLGSLKAFKCKALYNSIFEDYEKALKRNIEKWENEIKKANIDSITSLWGPIDNITSISTERKMITWKKETPVYYVNLNSTTKSVSSEFGSSETNIYSTSRSFINGISSLFLFGNSNRTTNVNYSGRSLGIVTTQNNQSGNIRKEDEGYSLTIIQDRNNNTISVFHQHIFSEPKYGLPFRFISF